MAPSTDDDVQRLVDSQAYREAFDLLLERYWKKVFHLSYSFVRERGAAEDLTQETFLKLWRALPGYNAEASFSTWIYVIARNTCLTHLRGQGRRKTLPLDDPAVRRSADRARHQRAVVEQRLECESLLALLSDDQRQVVALYYLEGRSCEEVAAMLGIAPGTVRSQLHRARRRFAAAVPKAMGETCASGKEVGQ
ncbi:MAG: sigma-70 family RNA polymerase sigma factor [Bryobacterales bacterium]